MSFKDHFSGQSQAYADSRPDYPAALYKIILDQVKKKSLCWDVATGNGQAAIALAHYFDRVVATDASQEQIDQAFPKDNIEYCCEPAEQSSLADQSVDLVTVAQALHWFDFDAFYREVERVLKPGGVIAAWTYGLISVNESIDPCIKAFYSDTLKPHWPKERRYVDNNYRTIPFPFKEKIQSPALALKKSWTVDQCCRYFNSWSAVKNYEAETGENPVEFFRADVAALWEESLQVSWPIVLRLGVKP